MSKDKKRGLGHRYLSLSAIASAILLSGCVTIPEAENDQTLSEVRKAYSDGWNEVEPIQFRESGQKLEVVEPGQLPADIYEKIIDIEIGGTLTIEKLMLILKEAGIPSMSSSSELGDFAITLPSFNGSIGSLLGAISKAHDISYSWNGNLLVLEKESRYILRVPQQEDVLDAISSSLTEFGANNVAISKETGMVSYTASKRAQDNVLIYLDKVAHNSAVINLQLAVINVKLDSEKNKGFDWSSLAVTSGDFAIAEGLSAPESVGELFKLNSGGLAMSMARSSMTLQAALSMLSNYGQSQTAQNLTLKTMSGLPVKINSGNKIHYIDSISTSFSGDNLTSSGVETKQLDLGFKAEVSPLFNAEENSITLSLDLNLDTLIGFRQFGTGQEGSLVERPEIQSQTLNSTVRLEAGETALVGGLIYESISDLRNSLSGLENMPVGSQKVKVSKNAMFILLRPTVTIYGPKKIDSISSSL